MLIAVTGAKGSGKDTLAQRFIRDGFQLVKMAGPLKAMMQTLYIESGLLDEAQVYRKIEGDLKEVPCPRLGGKTPRYAMQTLGTEWRDLIDQDLWTSIFRSSVRELLREGTPVICTDLRFAHELEVIRGFGGHVVKVTRPGTGEGDSHSSETEMKALPFDFLVENEGSFADLFAKVELLHEELCV